ncbi:DUF4227 family protein [Paenibacillus spiritus]|uniref:DUF4227 family protein n=1 Tax=Paenibacillus spiritus TaxID=2496557 RepID=A0A5J5GID3_9BACL|nr:MULTISPECIES: DUF4227 family protein [Paenibacillus]KAA9007438.1 DUF4227 family protein [Paenibacillus spiritus]
MVIVVSKSVRRLLLIALFMVLCGVFHELLGLMGGWLPGPGRPEPSETNAVKAFRELGSREDAMRPADRLLLFYRSGE